MPHRGNGRGGLGRVLAIVLLLAVGAVGGPGRGNAAEPLTLQLPADVRLPCDRTDDTRVTGMAEATGGCGGVTLSFIDSLALVGASDTLLLRIWTVVDSCGETRTGIQKLYLTSVRPRIAVLPLENLAESEEGSRVLVRLLQNAVLQSPQLELISTGAVESGLLRGRIRQPFLMEDEQRRRLAEVLDARYFLVGSLLAYETFDDPYSGPIPVVDCALQLIATATGETVWSGTRHAVGSDGEWLFGLGVEHDIARMAKRLADNALRDALRAIKGTPCLMLRR